MIFTTTLLMKTHDSIRLPEYDFARMPQRRSPSVFFIGPRDSGKSAVLCNVCCALALDAVHVFCSTRDACREYEEQVPGCSVYGLFDETVLQGILDAQRHLSLFCHRNNEPLPRVGVVIDDCVDFGHDTVRFLLMNGALDKFSVMLSVSHMGDIPLYARAQMDVVVMFPEADVTRRELLRTVLLGGTPDEELVEAFRYVERAALVFDDAVYRKMRLLDENRNCLFFYKEPWILSLRCAWISACVQLRV